MKRISIKFVWLLLIPLLLFASSPLYQLYCEGEMTACECCQPLTTHNIASPELAFQNFCCVIDSSQAPTINVAPREINDFSKTQFHAKALVANSFILNLSIATPHLKILSQPFHSPHFPLFLSKQSFLV